LVVYPYIDAAGLYTSVIYPYIDAAGLYILVVYPYIDLHLVSLSGFSFDILNVSVAFYGRISS